MTLSFLIISKSICVPSVSSFFFDHADVDVTTPDMPKLFLICSIWLKHTFSKAKPRHETTDCVLLLCSQFTLAVDVFLRE